MSDTFIEAASKVAQLFSGDLSNGRSITDVLRRHFTPELTQLRSQLSAATERAERYLRDADTQREVADKRKEQLRAAHDVMDKRKEQLRVACEKLSAATEREERLRGALARQRQGLSNLLEFRRIRGSDRYGALIREEIEQSMAEIDAALSALRTATGRQA
jgi:chromosome segregation ATPase